MSASKILTVFGATGNQGGSVIAGILGSEKLSSEYKLRGVTRNTDSAKAKALKEKGVEMVVGDLEDYDSVAKAVEGSYAVFAVTNYWEKPDMQREVNQGKRMADAAKATGVKQFIWSNLPNVEKVSGGKYPHVYHFDGKAQIGEYVVSLGIPMVSVEPGFYMQNLKTFGMQKHGESYTMAFPFPGSTLVNWFDAEKDLGNFVAGALLHPEVFGQSPVKRIAASSYFKTCDEVIEIFKKTTGKEANYYHLPDKDFMGYQPTPEIGQEMLENFLLIRDYGYYGPDTESSIELVKESNALYTVQAAGTLEEYFRSQQW